MQKRAEIKTTLQPHQKRALIKALRNNLILAHGTGTGKTLTAIAIADALGKPATALVPAPLVANFKKEIAKHKQGGPDIQVMSLPTAVRRNLRIPTGSTLIVDEAHALRNPDTKRQNYVRQLLQRAGRVYALTGTPGYNDVTDWASLINIVAKRPIVPVQDAEFKKRYINQVKVPPTLWARLLYRAKPGVVHQLKNVKELRRAFEPYVDVFDKEIEKPKVIDESIEVPMSEDQTLLYRYLEGNLPSEIRYKLRHNLPPSKQEAKQLNSFLTGVRQASNTTRSFSEALTPEQLEQQSTKLREAADRLAKMYRNDPNFRGLVYSNFIGSGVEPYGELLKARGIPYRTFTGALDAKEKKQVVDDYNSGKIPVIIGSGSASEGLDLKGTKLIQLLDPHFNEARLDQVIGRGVRYKSHAHLPESERKVTVQRYYSTLPDDRSWLGKLFTSPTTSVDQYLAARAQEKQQLMDQVTKLFRPES